MAEYKRVEYMCRYCGTKRTMSIKDGRPQPGRCPRRKSDQPHSWIVNRKL